MVSFVAAFELQVMFRLLWAAIVYAVRAPLRAGGGEPCRHRHFRLRSSVGGAYVRWVVALWQQPRASTLFV